MNSAVSNMSNIQKVSKSIIKYTSRADEIFRGLNGIFAVYKPAGNSLRQVRRTLLAHMCRDLNSMEVRPPEPYVHIDGETNRELTVRVEPSYADHPLVVGPRYQPEDFKLSWAHNLSRETSGILLMGINRRGSWIVRKIEESAPTRFFKVKGILGQATDNLFIDGKIREKSTWKHVRRHHLDMLCATMQSSHQKKMFEACGIDIQSQAAYELAVQGPIRPMEKHLPMVYSMKCVDYNPPEFTLEIVCINETDEYLKGLVHNLGIEVRSTATCTQLQCFQYGVFTLDNALLKKDWDLENVARSIRQSRKILALNPYLFNQEDPILREYLDKEDESMSFVEEDESSSFDEEDESSSFGEEDESSSSDEEDESSSMNK